jgi:hypothetical protein
MNRSRTSQRQLQSEIVAEKVLGIADGIEEGF